ncbi:MAG: peptidylprolyl isomerase [Candidatus Sedimenticola sp. 1PA]
MIPAKQGDTVKIHYTGTLDDGSMFDSSVDREPLEFTIGSEQVIPGFDKAVTGMITGEKKSVSIPPEDAYGPLFEEMIRKVPKNVLPEDLDPTEGMTLQAESPEGRPINMLVTEVDEETITVDGNHPLAGQTLNFDIELVTTGQ